MIGFLKETLAIYLVVPLIFGVGLYLSYHLRWIQFTKLKKAWQLTFEKSSKGNFSSFAAVATVLGGNLGTGNIAGIAVALSTGGPGSLFWMWVMASLGAIVKYAGCYLGLKYRIHTKTRKYLGGPMYYIVLSRLSSYTAESWISFLFSLLVFYCFLYRFLKKYKKRYTLVGLWMLGAAWVILAASVNFLLAYFVYHFSIAEILQTYHIFQGEPWGWVLIGILVAPRVVYSLEKA